MRLGAVEVGHLVVNRTCVFIVLSDAPGTKLRYSVFEIERFCRSGFSRCEGC